MARHENTRGTPYAVPLVLLMLAGISLLDGAVMAVQISPVWLVAGACGCVLILAVQQLIRGDLL